VGEPVESPRVLERDPEIAAPERCILFLRIRKGPQQMARTKASPVNSSCSRPVSSKSIAASLTNSTALRRALRVMTALERTDNFRIRAFRRSRNTWIARAMTRPGS